MIALSGAQLCGQRYSGRIKYLGELGASDSSMGIRGGISKVLQQPVIYELRGRVDDTMKFSFKTEM